MSPFRMAGRHNARYMRSASADPSRVSPPGGIRRSRRVALGLSPISVSRLADHGGRRVERWESTPFRYSHPSGTGGSDRVECAWRIARLSLRLRPPSRGLNTSAAANHSGSSNQVCIFTITR
ncbi:hypothetical protein L226DRAFT_611544 [Lentinus tigrinus ALCF2SS1-7]|uniref:uncharacterized protein n=1 Tax=Lentinus tigrinus ALCF2SS1-7 TaxID=1328758 RepID=UPI0011660876|nr:hypothetical protein L226DRAFT_611544 [Lentinus tigrinus ALCF2SS1-7]